MIDQIAIGMELAEGQVRGIGQDHVSVSVLSQSRVSNKNTFVQGGKNFSKSQESQSVQSKSVQQSNQNSKLQSARDVFEHISMSVSVQQYIGHAILASKRVTQPSLLYARTKSTT